MDHAQAEKMYRRANALYERARWDKALALLDQLAQSFPKNASIQYSRALCLGRLGKIPEAIEVCGLLTDTLGDVRGSQLRERLAALPEPSPPPPQSDEELPVLVPLPEPEPASASEISDLTPPAATPERETLAARLALFQRKVSRSSRRSLIACGVAGAVLIAAFCIWTVRDRDDSPAPAANVKTADEAGAATPGADRRLRFPSDRSLGTLYVRDRGTSDEWRLLGDTFGDAVIPSGKELRLDVTPEGAADLSSLAQLPPDALVELSLRSTPASDDSLAHVAGLTGLEALCLSETQVTDAGLAHLAALTALRELNVGQTRVTGPGLTHLTGLAALETLDLHWDKLTADAPGLLAKLTALRHLNVAATGLADAAIADLKAALPNCSIVVQ